MNCKAIIGNVFCSIEGEGRHVGRPTLFIHVADGQFKRDAEYVFEMVDPHIHECLVLDTCEGIYMDWRGFALKVFERLWDVGPELILETRGETDLTPFFSHRHLMIYINYTEGWTKRENLKCLRPHDQIKFLFYDWDEYLQVLEQAADVRNVTRCPIYLMPRGIEGEVRREVFSHFLENRIRRSARYNGLRMMLIEHEEVGIL